LPQDCKHPIDGDITSILLQHVWLTVAPMPCDQPHSYLLAT
jgi:hypothetical protein